MLCSLKRVVYILVYQSKKLETNFLELKKMSEKLDLTNLKHVNSAFLDLLETSEVKDLATLRSWNYFDLSVYMWKKKVNIKILDRIKGGQMSGEIFYSIGTREPVPDEKPRWWYFASHEDGVKSYTAISKLSTIIREYCEV